jgi:hypothetical protein
MQKYAGTGIEKLNAFAILAVPTELCTHWTSPRVNTEVDFLFSCVRAFRLERKELMYNFDRDHMYLRFERGIVEINLENRHAV